MGRDIYLKIPLYILAYLRYRYHNLTAWYAINLIYVGMVGQVIHKYFIEYRSALTSGSVMPNSLVRTISKQGSINYSIKILFGTSG